MMNRRLASLVTSLALLLAALPAIAVPAFPGAEGAAATTPGGRGGRVYVVTSLADAGPGSLREAVETKGPRVIVFSVAGIIDLKSDLVISQPFLTLAGQSAPGDGICLRGRSLRVLNAHDVVLRYLRVRPGPSAGEPLDGIEVRDSQRVIIDHCSVGWTIDEAVNTWHGVKDITVQWCLIAEPLDRSVHPKGAHGYGASLGGENGSYHHNLFSSATARNPSVAGNHLEHTVAMDFRCNVIFNWQHRTCDGKPVSCNVVNNYYKPGPATRPEVRRRIAKLDDTKKAYGYPSSWYIAGNTIEGAPDLTADNWAGVEFEPGVTAVAGRSEKPFPYAAVTTQSAVEAYPLVVAQVGATLPRRDAVDERVLRAVRDPATIRGSGIIDHPDEVGGYPRYQGEPVADQDHDGMPDAWEKTHGLDPAKADDASADRDQDGYTNIEEYLNSVVKA